MKFKDGVLFVKSQDPLLSKDKNPKLCFQWKIYIFIDYLNIIMFVCFVCLFVVFCPARKFFIHAYGDVSITGEGLQILTYAQHSWPLSSKGSLACHTYCHTGASVYDGHLRQPVTHTYCQAL